MAIILILAITSSGAVIITENKEIEILILLGYLNFIRAMKSENFIALQ